MAISSLFGVMCGFSVTIQLFLVLCANIGVPGVAIARASRILRNIQAFGTTQMGEIKEWKNAEEAAKIVIHAMEKYKNLIAGK